MFRVTASVLFVCLFMIACTKTNPTAPRQSGNKFNIVNHAPTAATYSTSDYYSDNLSFENSHSGTLPAGDSISLPYDSLPNQTLIVSNCGIIDSRHVFIGEQISLSESVYPASAGTKRYEINIPAQYFFLNIRNTTNSVIDQVTANFGTSMANTAATTIPIDNVGHPVGYFRSLVGTPVQVRFVQSSSNAPVVYQTIYYPLPMTANQNVTVTAQ